MDFMTNKQNDIPNDVLDTFWLRSLYPDAGATFEFAQASLEDIKDDSIIVLDANVLLLPYRLGATSLEEIKKRFDVLAKADRIFLPAQAVREFLKHRANRIRDVLRDLGNQASQIQVVADRRIGFLESDDGYKELIELSQKIKELKNSSLKVISQIGDRLRHGIGSDPVSSAYREIFVGRVIELDDSINDDQLKEEMFWRYRHSIPPGYKDKNKPDDGAGDFLIWKTILQIASSRQAHCIFVTEDAKSDWWVQSEGVFQPRLELVEEYRRASGGRTLHLLPLSGLLEFLGAQSDAIDEARQLELVRQQRLVDLADRARRRLRAERNARQHQSDFPPMDRNDLVTELARLSAESVELLRKKTAIDRTIRDPDAISALNDLAVADLFRRRDEIDDIRRENFQRRKSLEDMMRSQVLDDDEN
jgi:PIN like domain